MGCKREKFCEFAILSLWKCCPHSVKAFKISLTNWCQKFCDSTDALFTEKIVLNFLSRWVKKNDGINSLSASNWNNMIIFLVVVLTRMINQIIYLKQKNCLKSGCSYNLSCLQMYIVNVYTIEKYETNWKKYHCFYRWMAEPFNRLISAMVVYSNWLCYVCLLPIYAELFLLIIIYFSWHLIVYLICIKSSICSIKRFSSCLVDGI